ncbi:hypothetical protein E1B28_007240 [Marasmius oreades]|uniref:Uncharacterized protein n=1 Tax=Marasmius oreades TaxID=181124 RepID=A0A9P7S1H2_9AGAR|nr:uncharacterized protein E1B28_007240 [Marasmius oreades]KAG7093570.1 hypothetical protein E1B28_007240 [Marasmius oreades]
MSQPLMLRNNSSAVLASDMKSSRVNQADSRSPPLSSVENLNNGNRQYPPEIVQGRETLQRIVQAFSTRISGE